MKQKNINKKNQSGTNLTIRGIASSSNHLMQLIPINHLTIRNAPYANLSIKGPTNEVSIINRIKLDASYCQEKKYINNVIRRK